MEEKNNQANVTINISGGHNIVQPNATQATMIINGGKATVEEELQNDIPAATSETVADSRQAKDDNSPKLSESAIRLHKYVDDEKRFIKYLEELQTCDSATELADVIVRMWCNENDLLDFEIKKERFIKNVLSLAPNVKTGNTVSNIRARIKLQLEQHKGK